MKIRKNQKVLISYIICLLILAVGWYFFIQFGRKNVIDDEIIHEIQGEIVKNINFYINIRFNGTFDIEKKENLKKSIKSIFQNPKLSSYIYINIYNILQYKSSIDPLNVTYDEENIEFYQK